MIQKLRFKFVVINMSIVSLMLVVILGLVFYFTQASLEAESVHMLESIAAKPFHLGIPSERGEDVRLPFFTIQLGPFGELASTGGGYYDLSDSEFLQSLVEETIASPHRLGVIPDYHLRYYRSDTPVSQYLVFADTSSEEATLSSLVQTCLIIGCVSFLLFLWISILLSKWAVRPVELAWQQQRQFVADASHELKTPLTVIITNAELAQNPEYSPESRERFLTSIQTVSHQMKRLVEQLLQLARADHTDAGSALAPVDLSKLVSDGLLPFEPIFFEAGLALEVKLAEHIQVPGDEAQLRQVLEILLDNARKYTQKGGTTWVDLRRRGKNRCLLTVADEGEAIAPQTLNHLFERFYRADPARSRDGSFGLGLSIAEAIVKRHRGRIWAESREGVNTFRVELPCL